jgi:hypothetical protein
VLVLPDLHCLFSRNPPRHSHPSLRSSSLPPQLKLFSSDCDPFKHNKHMFMQKIIYFAFVPLLTFLAEGRWRWCWGIQLSS